MNINRTQDFSISLTKVVGTPHDQGRLLPQPQLQGAEPRRRRRRLVPGRRSTSPTTPPTRSTPAFGFANAALGVFTSYQQQSKFVEGSFIYNKVDWYVQDNWKVNSQADARLRPALRQPAAAVRPVPAVVELLPGATGSPAAAPALYVARLRRTAPTPARATQPSGDESGDGPAARAEHVAGDRPARAEHGRRDSTASSRPATASRRATTSGRRSATRRASARRTTSPASQRFVLRGGFGLFFDRRTATRSSRRSATRRSRRRRPCATRSCRASARRPDDAGPAVPDRLQVRLEAAIVVPVERRDAVRAAVVDRRATSSYVGQHGFNLLQNVDINAVDFGVAFTPAGAGPDGRRERDPGRLGAARSTCCGPIRASAPFSRTGASAANTYHSIQTSFNRRFRNGFSLGLNYTLGLSNTGNAGNPVRLDHGADGSYCDPRPIRRRQDELLKDLGLQRHTIKGNMVWDLPKMSAHGRRAERPRGDRQRLAAVGHPDGGHRRSRTASASAMPAARWATRQAAPTPNGTGNQNLTGSPSYAPRIADHRRSRLGLLRQPIRAVQHRGVLGAVGVGVEPEPRPRVGPELSARLLRQDRRSGAGAQLPSRRHSQHPVPHRGVQRVQRGRLQRLATRRCR